jgi:hypothetical protein
VATTARQDLEIASLRNHGAPTLEELTSRICPRTASASIACGFPSRARDLTSVRVDFITQAINFASRLSPNSRASCIAIRPR